MADAQCLTSNQLLAAYASGYFPMADDRHADELYWYAPEQRGILPFNTFHVPASLRKFMRHHPYEIRMDTAFEQVIRACADIERPRHQGTWINDTIIALYCELAQKGFAHSVECWQEDRLAGGLYGISLKGAFFGESMFSHAANASKIALVHLVEHLNARGFLLLDTQYINDHLLQFGVREIAREDYMELLAQALNANARF